MKSLCFAAAILSMLPAAQQSFAATPAKPDAPQAAAMQLIETFPAPPGVAGRLDHITVDPRHIRIFVSALGNDSIEVFDFSSAKWLFSIKGMNTPKGILYVPQVSKLFVVNIGDNTLKVLDDSYHVIKTLDIGREADYIRYDPGSKKIMVGYSESQMVGGMLLIDPITYERTALKLDAPPEDFAFDEGGHYIYANLHDLNAVDVVDRSTGSIKKMEIQNSGRPTPMALNEDDHRLFVVSRSPADLIVINTDTGKEVARISVGGISADLLFDSKAKRLYNVNGTGYVNVIQQLDPNHYELVENVPTAVGARSGFLVPQIQRLVVAVPTDGVRPAGLWEYQTNSASHAR